VRDLRQEGWYADLNTAIRRSSGALRKTNRRRHTGTIITEGDYRFIAGVNIQLLTFDDAKDNGKASADFVYVAAISIAMAVMG